MIRLSIMLAGAFALGACTGDAKVERPPIAPVTAGVIGPDGIRRIAVEANAKGYTPDRIAGKPGEKLILVFTRTVDVGCVDPVKTPDGKLVMLPKGTPVEVAVALPAHGELRFACSMDMFHGAVIVDAPG